MGLLISILCSCLYCLERGIAWLLCSAVLLTVMFVAFLLAMYGITVGYHMAQKKMNVIMERKIAEGDVDHDPSKYVGTYHRLRRGLNDHPSLKKPQVMTTPIPPPTQPVRVGSQTHDSLRIYQLRNDIIKELEVNLTDIILRKIQETDRFPNTNLTEKQGKETASNGKSSPDEVNGLEKNTFLRRFYKTAIYTPVVVTTEKVSAIKQLQERLWRIGEVLD